MAKHPRTPLRKRIQQLCSEIDALQSAIDRQLQENESHHETPEAVDDLEPQVTVFEHGRRRNNK